MRLEHAPLRIVFASAKYTGSNTVKMITTNYLLTLIISPSKKRACRLPWSLVDLKFLKKGLTLPGLVLLESETPY